MLITVSRQYGAGGSAVAERVAGALDWRVVDNELLERIARRAGLPPEDVAELEERVPSFIERLARVLASGTPELFPPPNGTVPELAEQDLVRITETVVAEVAAEGRVVLVGRAAPAVLARERDALHVKVVASRPFRVRTTMERLSVDAKEAERIVTQMDAHRARYHRDNYGRDWTDASNYDVVVNAERLGLDGAVDVVVGEARRRGWR
ncbi:MAG TPA: cytidylate kinase-like family protein [Gemmatimonadales bacterium]|nr:cytidylate kinase-like family protein [Gemmatimonadales bacterium]